MAPWQIPDRDQLTAKYLIKAFALTQLAWPPWSNGVSCTHAKGQGLLGFVWDSQAVPGLHPPIHPLPISTAQHMPRCVLHLRPAQLHPRGSARAVGQCPQPLGCFTACCSSLWPVKSICGSARRDKLLNCVCRRFMLGRTAGAAGMRWQLPSPARRAVRVAAEPQRGHTAGIAPLQICKSSAAAAAPARADSAARDAPARCTCRGGPGLPGCRS